MKEFRDLKIWQQAMDFAEQVYLLPIYDVVFIPHVQRAGTSVVANIAEGIGIHTEGRKLYHFKMARGSLAETVTFLELMHSLGLLGKTDFGHLLQLGGKIYDQLTAMITLE